MDTPGEGHSYLNFRQTQKKTWIKSKFCLSKIPFIQKMYKIHVNYVIESCYKTALPWTWTGLKWSGLKKIMILSFVNLFSFYPDLCLSQLEINHVIHEPTAKN